MQWHANAACWSPCISEQTGTDTITNMAYAVIAWKTSSCKESDMTRQKQSWFHYLTLQVCFQSILIASFQVRMAHIPWLRADIASKWDSQCLTCSPPKGLRVTCVGGICWHTICKSCTTECFLHDIMLGIISGSGQLLNCIETIRAKSDGSGLCLCAQPTS